MASLTQFLNPSLTIPPVTPRTITIALSCVCLTYVYSFFRDLRRMNYLPGYRPLFSPTSLFGAILPSTWWNLGHNWAWNLRESSFFNHTHDIISLIPILHGKSYFLTCSADVLKQLLGNEGKTHLVKPQDITLSSVTGPNIASVNGPTHTRRRRIVAPAFNNKTYALLRSESALLYEEVSSAEWEGKDEVVIESVNEFMIKYALIIVARCAFGLPMSWTPSSPSASPSATIKNKNEEEMDFGEAIHIVTSTIIARLILPTWAFKLPIKPLQRIESAWHKVKSTVSHSITTQKQEQSITAQNEGAGSTGDVLSRLVQSIDGGKNTLSEEEVMADIFTLLFAGHETTASVLSATIALLALHPEEQKKAYEEVVKVCEGGVLTITDETPLPHLQACFWECGRLYPAAFIVARETTSDVPVKVSHPKEDTVVIPKGSRVIMDLISIHHNPNTYQHPSQFLPSRWLSSSLSSAQDPDLPIFGTGPRTCPGRKFASTEALVFLAHLLRDWEVSVVRKEGESKEMCRERVMNTAGMMGTAFSIGGVGVKMRRRV